MLIFSVIANPALLVAIVSIFLRSKGDYQFYRIEAIIYIFSFLASFSRAAVKIEHHIHKSWDALF